MTKYQPEKFLYWSCYKNFSGFAFFENHVLNYMMIFREGFLIEQNCICVENWLFWQLSKRLFKIALHFRIHVFDDWKTHDDF
jgi:hypothetical protein